jgi:hypothetical protein
MFYFDHNHTKQLKNYYLVYEIGIVGMYVRL